MNAYFGNSFFEWSFSKCADEEIQICSEYKQFLNNNCEQFNFLAKSHRIP